VNRQRRQEAILSLVRGREISTQSELADALHEQGFDAVQTTVSRDVSELGLQKVRAASGRLVYAPPGTGDSDRLARLWPVLRRFALRVESSGNVVLVTTPSGCANALAQAIDDSLHPDVLGTVAGDNTILVLAREGVAGATLRDELRGQLLEGAA
jgi:transcriptional regulator of arginine metabolism